MTPLRMSRLAAETSGRLFGEDALFNSISTDTRTLHTGQLFVAISGPHYDGNLFVEEALARGAAGALVHKRADCGLPQVQVKDTRAALGSFARYWRNQFDIPVIAVTGSNGKTTIKEMTASILRCRGPVLATRGNLNNEIGVPMTLFEISLENSAAVVELGAEPSGRDQLPGTYCAAGRGRDQQCRGRPIWRASGASKGSPGPRANCSQHWVPVGVAVLNADDRFAPLWRSMVGRRQCVTFGMDKGADFMAEDVSQQVGDSGVETRFRLTGKAGEADICMPFAGLHNVRNALAAAAAAWSAGASLDDIREWPERSLDDRRSPANAPDRGGRHDH